MKKFQVERQNMNMNKKDKENINVIESMRRRAAGTNAKDGKILQVVGKLVEFKLETGKSGFGDKAGYEEFNARLIDVVYFHGAHKADLMFYDCARGMSSYLTSAEIYNVIKAGVKSYAERGF